MPPVRHLLLAGLLTAASQAPVSIAEDGPRPATPSTPAGLYRAAFEPGLAALAAGRDGEAAERFRAAGELAPDAPVWRAYLARALGEDPPEAPSREPDPRGPWTALGRSRGEAVFDPTGERLVSRDTLWDARTGERVAVLTGRLAAGVWRWRFDRTGRLLVGMGRWGDDPLLVRGLDVRDARTGDPVGIAGAEEIELPRRSTFAWLPRGSEVAGEEARAVVRLPGPGGTLCIAPDGRFDEQADAFSPDRGRRVVGESWEQQRIVESSTGRVLVPLAWGPPDTRDVEVLTAADACVVAAADGSLRRVDLASGATTASASDHAGSPDVVLRSIDAQRLLTWDTGRLLCLRDPTTLEPSITIRLEPGEHVLAVVPDGARVVTRVRPDTVRLRTLVPEPGAVELPVSGDEARGAAFSRDGARVAVVTGEHLRVFEAGSGAPLSEVDLRDLPDPGLVAFYGDERIAVGWGDEALVGVDVLRLTDGARLARLTAPTCWLGGSVMDLRCDPDLGQVVFSVSSCGVVMAYDEDRWQERWRIDYFGGNAATLQLQRPDGSRRLHVSGMLDANARVVDVASGEVLAQRAVEGLRDLDGTENGRFVVGAGRGGLVVLSGESFEPLYVRHEDLDGAAWIVRDGRRLEVAGGTGWSTSAWHLARGGTSRPADCWDAWLVDPLGLCPLPLDALPEPPRIVSGPPRALRAEGEEATLEVEVLAEEPLLGIQVEVAGRDTRLVRGTTDAGGGRSSAAVRVDGPWPARVRLRALTRSGVLGAPWRVDLD